MDDTNKIERFYKHRRNMLLVSGIFIFLVLSGGTVESINVLGSTLKFSNPDVPVKILFLAVIYMLIKYFQFLFELNGSGFKSKFHELVSFQVPHIAKRVADTAAGGDAGYKIGDYDIIGYKGYFTYEVLQNTANHVEGDTIKKIAAGISTKYEIGPRYLWKTYIRVFSHILIKTTWLAEFVMPLLLATIGIYLYLCTNIHEIIWLNSNN